MTNHTPGPWRADHRIIENDTEPRHIEIMVEKLTDDPRFFIHPLIGKVSYGQVDEMKANARLIAAAPELLAACIDASATYRTFRNVPVEEQEWTSLDDAALDALFTAIAKATQEI